MLGDVFERYVGEATCGRSLVAFHKLFDVVAFMRKSSLQRSAVHITSEDGDLKGCGRSGSTRPYSLCSFVVLMRDLFTVVLPRLRSFFSDILHPRPDHENNDMKKPETAWRRFISFSRFFFFLHGGLFHFLYTCSRADVIMVVSTKPPIIMRVCFFPVRSMISHVLCIHFLTWCS